MFTPLAVSYANTGLPVSPGDDLQIRARRLTVHIRASNQENVRN